MTQPNPTHNDDCDTGYYEDMCPDCQRAVDATRCRHCSGSGVYSDEDVSMACPYCGATGEAATYADSCAA
jgi:primosomal protein N'